MRNTGVEENLSMEESDSEAKPDEKETETGMFVPILQELTRTVEAIKEHKVQEDQNVASMATDTESMFKIFIVLKCILNIHGLEWLHAHFCFLIAEMLVIPDTFKDKNK